MEGNSRLTAATGALLALLLLVEGYTILDVRGYITLHTALGLILIGPVTLKCASTVYRFTCYYVGRGSYVAKGPPHIVLRVIGPLVVMSSVALLATGVALLVDQGRSGTWLTLHQASFIVWVALMTLHFLGHLRDAVLGTARDLGPRVRDPARRGRTLRFVAVAASLIVGVGLAAAFTPSAASWDMQHGDRGRVTHGR